MIQGESKLTTTKVSLSFSIFVYIQSIKIHKVGSNFILIHYNKGIVLLKISVFQNQENQQIITWQLLLIKHFSFTICRHLFSNNVPIILIHYVWKYQTRAQGFSVQFVYKRAIMGNLKQGQNVLRWTSFSGNTQKILCEGIIILIPDVYKFYNDTTIYTQRWKSSYRLYTQRLCPKTNKEKLNNDTKKYK